MSESKLSEAGFRASIAKIFGGGALKSWPKAQRDRLAFLGAVVLSLDGAAFYSELEINAALGTWLRDMEALDAMDHVTLRRYLVDQRLLSREKSGTDYRVNKPVFDELFAGPIASCNVKQIVSSATAQRLARKAAWAEQAQVSK